MQASNKKRTSFYPSSIVEQDPYKMFSLFFKKNIHYNFLVCTVTGRQIVRVRVVLYRTCDT